MIAFIRGVLAFAAPSMVIVEAFGVGYRIFIPASLYPKLPKIGTELLLHTLLITREHSQTLYGFSSDEERKIFEDLIAVSGVGPKIAISVIGHLSLDEMQEAIMEGNSSLFSRVPGIGKKTAARLMIDLKDKFAGGKSQSGFPQFASTMLNEKEAQKITDALNALVNLGYTQIAAENAVKKTLKTLPESSDLATLITHALKQV